METETEYISLPRKRLYRALTYGWLAGACFGSAVGFVAGMWLGG